MKSKRTSLRFLAPVAALGLMAGPLQAQEESEVVEGFESHAQAAWDHVHAIAAPFMSPDAISKLQLIAYHLAAEQVCDTVHTDPEKVGAAMLALRPANWDELDEEKQKHWNAALATNFGIVLGVMIAEHAGSAVPFCAEVDALMANPEVDWHLFDEDSEPEAEAS